MLTVIDCPKCGSKIEVTQALREQVEKEVTAGIAGKHEKELKEAILTAQEKTIRTMEQKSQEEIGKLKKEAEEKDKKILEAEKSELELRKKKNELEESKRTFELQVQRKMDEEREQIRQKTLSEISEIQKLKDREKEKMITDLKNALEDAQRKANQGSQQMQGEVQELDLEETLKTSFPSDVILGVEKGVTGADIRQTVKTARGNICGIILWESKRTKAWSDGWLTKLKEDLRAEKANVPVIVTSVLPKGAMGGIGLIEGVWVCSYTLYLPLAELIRLRLIDVARERFMVSNKGNKAELIYDYITGHEFIQQVEAIAEVYRDMNEQILRERAAFEKIWKTREAQVQKLFKSTSGILGSLRGYVGASLPPVKGLDLPELMEGGSD